VSEKLETRIKELERLAYEAYKRRDYVLEDKYDAERAELQKLLDDMRIEEPLTEKDLTPHKWNRDFIMQYGDARCEVCGMKYSYFRDRMKALNEWTEEEKHTKRFNESMRASSCKSKAEA